jgi:hypothetical protein
MFTKGRGLEKLVAAAEHLLPSRLTLQTHVRAETSPSILSELSHAQKPRSYLSQVEMREIASSLRAKTLRSSKEVGGWYPPSQTH